ncbi:MAG: hypothetical protein JOZ18_02465 [Chloroflexi bacterium]|nr:hypothetical protein [Chloroflexota bacterium]
MRTFDGFMVAFTESLFELKTFVPNSPQYRQKEQQIGRYCYEAEEYLPTTELRLLKGSLGVRESAWRSYKAAFAKGSSSGGRA